MSLEVLAVVAECASHGNPWLQALLTAIRIPSLERWYFLDNSGILTLKDGTVQMIVCCFMERPEHIQRKKCIALILIQN